MRPAFEYFKEYILKFSSAAVSFDVALCAYTLASHAPMTSRLQHFTFVSDLHIIERYVEQHKQASAFASTASIVLHHETPPRHERRRHNACYVRPTALDTVRHHITNACQTPHHRLVMFHRLHAGWQVGGSNSPSSQVWPPAPAIQRKVYYLSYASAY